MYQAVRVSIRGPRAHRDTLAPEQPQVLVRPVWRVVRARLRAQGPRQAGAPQGRRHHRQRRQLSRCEFVLIIVVTCTHRDTRATVQPQVLVLIV